jgi:hypothetical protein
MENRLFPERLIVRSRARVAGLAACALVWCAPLARAAELPEVREADILARNGGGLWSPYFAAVSKVDRRFSHCGLVVIDGGEAWVIHARGDDITGEGVVERESLAAFLAGAKDWALFRPDFDAAQRMAIAARAQAWERAKVPFDSAFDHTEASKLYCTELVWRAVLDATGTDICPQKTSYGGKTVLSLEDITRNRWCEEIARKK